MSDFGYACPNCSKTITASEHAFGSAVACPHCGAQVMIQRPPHPCPHCGEVVDAGNAFCSQCGADQSERPKLRLKEREPSPPPNLPQYPRITIRKRTFFDRCIPCLKAVALVVLIVAGSVLLLRSFSLSDMRRGVADLLATVRREESVSPAEKAPKEAEEVEAPTPEEKPATPALDRLIAILDSVGKSPLGRADSDTLWEYARHTEETAECRPVVAGVKSMLSLLQAGRDEQEGVRWCEKVRQNYAGVDVVELIDPALLRDSCVKCKGRGEIHLRCETCSGSRKCPRCGGRGTVKVVRKIRQSLRKSSGSRELGGGQKTETVTAKCGACGGSGRCRECGGTGKLASECDACGGTGKILSADKLRSAFDGVVARTLSAAKSMAEEGIDLELMSPVRKVVESWEAPASEMPIDASRMSLYDALLRLAKSEFSRLSIDVDALQAMAGIRVEAADFLSLTNAAALSDYLSRYAFVLKEVTIAHDADPVTFVTTEANWTYAAACWKLRSGKASDALELLSGRQHDTSEFGCHCDNLSQTLRVLRDTSSDIRSVSSALNQAVKAYKAAVYKASRPSPQRYLKGPGMRNDPREAAAQRARARRDQERAQAELDRVADSVDLLVGKLASSNGAVYERLFAALGARLNSEAAYLLRVLVANYEALLKIDERLRDANLVRTPSVKDLIGKIPEDVLARQRELQDTMHLCRSASARFAKPVATASDIQDLQKLACEVVAMDRANVMTRAAAGFFSTARALRAVDEILEGDNYAQRSGLEWELKQSEKVCLMAALAEALGKAGPVTSPLESQRGHTTVGLAVVMAGGATLPLSVVIEPAPVKVVKRSKSMTGYWAIYEETWLEQKRPDLVVFGDYGDKDVFMWISAIEVYKWLQLAFPEQVKDKRMRVEFHNLLVDKSGDSAGVTMATAAYSSIEDVAIRNTVAMTGSIRGDGSVHAVGGIAEKISGAVATEGIETVLLPKANRSDLRTVPLDQLCRIAIITSDNVETYIRYATDPLHNADVIRQLRRAQAMILTGDASGAIPILRSVARSCPEIYSARRLLEIITYFDVDDAVGGNQLASGANDGVKL